MKTILDVIGIILFYLMVGFWLCIGILLLPALVPTALLCILIDSLEHKNNINNKERTK